MNNSTTHLFNSAVFQIICNHSRDYFKKSNEKQNCSIATCINKKRRDIWNWKILTLQAFTIGDFIIVGIRVILSIFITKHIPTQKAGQAEGQHGPGPIHSDVNAGVYVSLPLHVIRLFWSKSDVPQPLRCLVVVPEHT